MANQWLLSNGFHGDHVEFYSTSEILERNETYEVQEYSPGYLLIANDSGSKVALMQAKADADNVFINYAGDMKIESMLDTGMTIKDWVSVGCPFSFTPEPLISAVEQVRLQLDTVPVQGIRGLLEIKKMASLEIGLAELREIDKHLPCTLGKMSYIRALRLAAEINLKYPCVSIWKEESPAVRLPLTNPACMAFIAIRVSPQCIRPTTGREFIEETQLHTGHVLMTPVVRIQHP